MMIEGGWTSISSSYQKVRETIRAKNSVVINSNGEFIAKGEEPVQAGGSWLDKYEDMSWADNPSFFERHFDRSWAKDL